MNWDRLKQVKIGKWISFLFFLTVIYILQNSYFRVTRWLADEKSLPLNALVLTGNIKHVSLDEVRSILVAQQDRLNFFTLEIAEIQYQLEQIPWIYSVSIRKRWPDTLKIHIVEQSIVAVWNDQTLLNRFGEIINASPESLRTEKVSLYGDDTLVADILTSYKKIHQLLKVDNLEIDSLTTDKRHSSELTLDNGIVLRLGQEQQLDRIERFLSLFPLIRKKYGLENIAYVDLRYDTGLAVGWKSGLEKQKIINGEP